MPKCTATSKSKVDAAFNQNEKAKKSAYNQRVIEIEHGSFTPLVFSAYGGFGRETDRFLTNLISKIAEKKDMPMSVVANYVRTKISFILVKSQVMCMRGSRRMCHQHLDAKEAVVVQRMGEIRDLIFSLVVWKQRT